MSLEILKKYNIKAKKSLWQNFLVNDFIVEEIANTIEVKWNNIVEVGPWYWALTQKLVEKKPNSISLVELDKDMIEILEKRLNNWDFELNWINFEINKIDVLKFEPKYDNYSVIANIPYYITSPIIRHFLYVVKNKPKKMVILMQKDVWDKIIQWQFVWKKWKVKSSVLSLFIAKKAYVDEVIVVWKQNFVPSPKVESSVLLFEIHDKYVEIDDKKFLELIKKWFSEPRKMLLKNLCNSWFEKDYLINIFQDLWLDLTLRWEDLDISAWIKLYLKININ